ncbi:RNA polymerase subunit sigma [Paenibacillus riograndensis]|uniref:RNA polymerase subunit sigma n=1 Tax=Paenibacillus riograndensis TaxID=483937 RepID=A0A132TS02_9BACL|nr:RNA polymerase sigma factor [Paenibacillus riograndensis]KWX74044.1 RNA polymerase subunit sigma [Paenibacillus riograndensis]
MDELDELIEAYDYYFRDVYIFVLSLSRNEQIAEEITQETFYKAIKQIEQFRGDCKISVWLCQIAKNTYFTYIGKQRRFDPLQDQEGASGFNLEQKLIDQAEALNVHKVLHALNEPFKEVLMLRVFGELSFDHISQIFGRTESWARVTYHRARLKIQKLLMEDEQ